MASDDDDPILSDPNNVDNFGSLGLHRNKEYTIDAMETESTLKAERKHIGLKEEIQLENSSKRTHLGNHNHNENNANISNSNSSDLQTTHQDSNFTYNKGNKGPYGVWIRKIKLDDSELNTFKVGSILYKKYRDINTIIRKSKFKVEVICKTANEANRLITDSSLAEHNLQVFIPGHRKYRKALIKGVSVYITDEEILTNIISEIKVHAIKRIMRRNRESTNDNDKWIPTYPTPAYKFAIYKTKKILVDAV